MFWQAVITYPATADATNAKFSLPANLAPEAGGGAEGRSGVGSLTTDSTAVSALQYADGVRIYKALAVAATNADMSGKYIYIGGMYYTNGV